MFMNIPHWKTFTFWSWCFSLWFAGLSVVTYISKLNKINITVIVCIILSSGIPFIWIGVIICIDKSKENNFLLSSIALLYSSGYLFSFTIYMIIDVPFSISSPYIVTVNYYQ